MALWDHFGTIWMQKFSAYQNACASRLEKQRNVQRLDLPLKNPSMKNFRPIRTSDFLISAETGDSSSHAALYLSSSSESVALKTISTGIKCDV